MPEVVSDAVPIHRSVMRLIQDDITELDVDAFVFYAEPNLKLGSGFGTAISVRGGPTIQKELDDRTKKYGVCVKNAHVHRDVIIRMSH